MTTRCKHDDTDFSVPLNRFSQEKCGKMHAASLEILDRDRCRLYHTRGEDHLFVRS